jgi:hypothetical protein
MPSGVRLSVQVRGTVVRKGLQDLTDAEAPKIGRQQIRTVMERIKRRMQVYPEERPGQSIAVPHSTLGTVIRSVGYRRTGLLGASWAIEDTPDRNGYRIMNTAARRGRAYALYVVGSAYGTGQAWMHRGRWQVLRTVTEEEVARLPQTIAENVSMVARRKGLTP